MKTSSTIWTPSLLPGLSKLSNARGETYFDFRKKLITNHKRVIFSIAVNWLAIFVIVALSSSSTSIVFDVLIVLILALLQHRVLNVLHEGTHYLLWGDRKINDLLTNIFSGWFVLNSVQSYRQTHIQHHRLLGTEHDPEANHMDKLDMSWLLSAISGVKTIKSVFRYRKSLSRTVKSKLDDVQTDRISTLKVPLIGLLIHACILVILHKVFGLQTLVCWGIATFIVCPFLGLLRNLLEHRYVDSVDTSIWDTLFERTFETESLFVNTVTTRTFTQSFLSGIYGSMGFTRHLLHHWDPSISFQNLDKVHKFLLESKIGPALKLTDSTYTRTFLHLWRR